MAFRNRDSALPTQAEKGKTMPAVNMRHIFYLTTTMIMLWGASILTSLQFIEWMK